MNHDRTPQLQQLMQQAGFTSFRALSQAAGVSERQVRRFKRGDLAQMRLETLLKLSQALRVSLPDLLEQTPLPAALAAEASVPQQEYDRLQTQLVQQQASLRQEFQQSALEILESLLLQLPTAAYAAQQNPQAPAVKLLPLLRPIDALLQAWEITAIAAVGSEIAYDPQRHQLLEGTAAAGDRVRVRYVGYVQGDRLLYRARVSPIKT